MIVLSVHICVFVQRFLIIKLVYLIPVLVLENTWLIVLLTLTLYTVTARKWFFAHRLKQVDIFNCRYKPNIIIDFTVVGLHISGDILYSEATVMDDCSSLVGMNVASAWRRPKRFHNWTCDGRLRLTMN